MSAIRDRIIGAPALQAARAARDLDALADGLNAQGAMAVKSRFVNMRTIVAELANADDIIKALTGAAAASPALAEMLGFLRSDAGMDIGHPNAQARVDALVAASVLTAAQGTALKDLASLPAIVSRDDVNAAMFNDDGSEKAA